MRCERTPRNPGANCVAQNACLRPELCQMGPVRKTGRAVGCHGDLLSNAPVVRRLRLKEESRCVTVEEGGTESLSADRRLPESLTQQYRRW